MKKIFLFLLITLSMTASACGKNETAKEVSDNTVFNAAFVKETPLVYRENIYNSEGELVQYKFFEYDENNCYKTVSDYQKDEETGEIGLFLQEDYSYDLECCFVTTTYVQKDNFITKTIYDDSCNVIYEEMPNAEYNAILTTYTYTYEKTDYVEETMVYKEGNDETPSLKRISTYNSNGDAICSIVQDDYNTITRTTDYEYEDGHIVSSHELFTKEYLLQETRLVTDRTYQYNEEGQLINEIQTTFNADTILDPYYREEIRYEYDSENRLVKETLFEQEDTDLGGELCGFSNVTEYIYESEE